MSDEGVKLGDREYPTSEVAKIVGVRPDVLRKWKARGFLKKAPQGVSGQGRSVECMWGKEAIEEAIAWAKAPRSRKEAIRALAGKTEEKVNAKD